MPNKQMSQAVKQTKHGKAAHYYLQAAQTCPPRDKGRTIRDVQPFVEAVWHFCQAEQWQDAYKLMNDEWLFTDLRRWGRNEQLLEIGKMLEAGKAQVTPSQVAHIHNNLGSVSNALGNKQEALRYYGEALSIRREVGDRGGEGTTLHNIGIVLLEQHNYRAGLASILLAKRLYEQVESPYVEYTAEVLDGIRQSLDDKEYAALLKEVEPQAQQIVEEALHTVG